MNVPFWLPFDESELKPAMEASGQGNKEPLKVLCQKEVDRFEQYIQRFDPQFSDGLVRIEKMAITGYLYQKLRGHLDAAMPDTAVHKERQDGET